jgi:hypothetical protein
MNAVPTLSPSTSRPYVLVPLPAGALLPDERAMMMAWQANCLRLQVPATASHVAPVRHAARHHVLHVFAGDPRRRPGKHLVAFAQMIELLVSELATNAVRYKREPDASMTVELSSSLGSLSPWAHRSGARPRPAAVKVSVEDDNPEPPPPAPVSPVDFDGENGRGLLLLYAHSIYADAVFTKAGGKRIRALVRVPTAELIQERAGLA